MLDWYPNAARYPYPELIDRATGKLRAYDPAYAWKGLLHSTESQGWPAYDNTAPHFTHDPRIGATRQHYRLSYPAMSLMQPSPGPATNKGRCVQIEIIGSCDPAKRALTGWNYLPGRVAGDLRGLPELMAWVEDQTGIAPETHVTWKPYPASYGPTNGVRMSGPAWKAYRGWCGHQHAPGNLHGDPGNIDIAGLLTREGPADMPLTNDDVRKILNYPLGDATVGECLLDAHELLQKKPWRAAEPISVADALQDTHGLVVKLADAAGIPHG